MPDQQDALFDVIIVGAGPAGATLALLLARSGLHVMLADRCALPRNKVCGGCLNAATLDALEHLDMSDAATNMPGAGYNCMRLSAGRSEVAIPLPRGVVIDRSSFDHALVQAAQRAGACVSPETSISAHCHAGFDKCASVRCTIAGRGTAEVRAHILVDASGLGSTLFDRHWHAIGPTRIGLGCMVRARDWGGPRPAEGELLMHCTDHGYVGIARVRHEQLNIAAAADPAYIRAAGSPAGAISQLLGDDRSTDGMAPDDIHWHGSARMNRVRSCVAGQRFFRVGDAAGYVEPFTGEGIAWAMTGATHLAPIVRQAVRCWDHRLAEQWTRYIAAARRQQRVCRTIVWALRHRAVRSGIMQMLEFLPGLAQPMIRSINTSRRAAHA